MFGNLGSTPMVRGLVGLAAKEPFYRSPLFLPRISQNVINVEICGLCQDFLDPSRLLDNLIRGFLVVNWFHRGQSPSSEYYLVSHFA